MLASMKWPLDIEPRQCKAHRLDTESQICLLHYSKKGLTGNVFASQDLCVQVTRILPNMATTMARNGAALEYGCVDKLTKPMARFRD